MSNDDKYGVGAGLLALGLAAGLILLMQLPPDVLSFLPHRERNIPEAVFDGIICVLALPAGIFFFVSAVLSGPAEQEAEKKGS
jgi:hypothetical protein